MPLKKNPGNIQEAPDNFNFETKTGQENTEIKTSQVEAEVKPAAAQPPAAEKSLKQKLSPKAILTKRAKPEKPQATSQANDPKVLEIKTVLGKGLGAAYQKMNPQQQQEFLAEEEKAAEQIKENLSSGKVKTNKIFKIIFGWLKMIPMVSKFFIKQEAKIKTDQIINLEQKK